MIGNPVWLEEENELVCPVDLNLSELVCPVDLNLSQLGCPVDLNLYLPVASKFYNLITSLLWVLTVQLTGQHYLLRILRESKTSFGRASISCNYHLRNIIAWRVSCVDNAPTFR